MSGNRALLDTCAAIAVLEADSAAVRELQTVDTLTICLTVLGELYFGAMKSRRVIENTARVESFVGACELLVGDRQTAQLYGAIKAELQQKGRPIPENDVWIAAFARQHDMTLYTKDIHFRGIDGVSIASW